LPPQHSPHTGKLFGNWESTSIICHVHPHFVTITHHLASACLSNATACVTAAAIVAITIIATATVAINTKAP
jgi:hypothetical protein